MKSLSEPVIESIIRGSLCYPSGDNCQPFFFRIVDPDRFEILHRDSVARHRLNYANRASILALGTLMTTIEIQAAEHGYKVEFQDLQLDSQIEKWVTVRLKKDSQVPNEFTAEDLARRHTDRRLYSSKPIGRELQKKIISESKDTEFKFYFQEEVSDHLLRIFQKIETEVWKDRETSQDVLKWIRFDEKSASQTQDGMTFDSLGVAHFNKPFLQIFKGRPSLYAVVTKLGLTKGNAKLLLNQIKNSAGIGWYFVQDSSPTTLIKVGQSFMRTWLRLNREGYGLQPITIEALGPYCQQFGFLPDDWSPQLRGLYSELTESLRNEFKDPEIGVPVWAFRTGFVGQHEFPFRQYRKNFETRITK